MKEVKEKKVEVAMEKEKKAKGWKEEGEGGSW